MKFCALLAGSLLLCCPIAAQNSDEPSRAPDNSTNSFVFVEGVNILPVAGKPFSGRAATTEWKRSAEDETVVTIHLIARIARDSQGRIFREVRNFVRAESYEHPGLKGITILDPLAHTRTACNIATRRCHVISYRASTTSTSPPPAGLANDGTSIERVPLGARELDHLTTVGTRETLTTDTGAVSTREVWYSPDLQVDVSTTLKNPPQGTQVIQVGDLSREEPDPSLFQVPPGFVVAGSSPKPRR